jgi:predicted PurR-regulated permease PerM
MKRAAKAKTVKSDEPRYFSDQDLVFIRRLILTIAVIAIAYFLWRISGILLLLFGAILIATLLRAFAEVLEAHLPVAPFGVTITALLFIGVFGAFMYLFGSQLAGQLAFVIEKIPAALNTAGERIGLYNITGEIERALKGDSDRPTLMWQAASIGYTIMGGFFDLILVLIAAVYLAADPKLYRRGVAKLFPVVHHPRIFDAMDSTGRALRLWFWGQLVTMVIVGVMSLVAYWWIGLPSPFALALIAGVTNFIPYLGPLLGAVPAIIFALAMDLETIFWTVGAILVIQQVEGHFLTPYIQRRVVLMPPVLVLFSIVVFGFLFGMLGVVLGVPLAVALAVLIKKLWMREVLGERTAIPGEIAMTTGKR